MAWFIPTFELAGKLGQDRLEVDASTVGDLIDKVAAEHGSAVTDAVKGAFVLINGRSINVLKGRRTKIAADDDVWLVKPSAGG